MMITMKKEKKMMQKEKRNRKTNSHLPPQSGRPPHRAAIRPKHDRPPPAPAAPEVPAVAGVGAHRIFPVRWVFFPVCERGAGGVGEGGAGGEGGG